MASDVPADPMNAVARPWKITHRSPLSGLVWGKWHGCGIVPATGCPMLTFVYVARGKALDHSRRISDFDNMAMWRDLR